MPAEPDPYAEFDSAEAVWISAAHSPRSGSWIEVAFVDGLIGLRNGADPSGPALVFTEAEWDDFVAGLMSGDYTFDDGQVVEMLIASESRRELVMAVSDAKTAYYEGQRAETPAQTDG